MENIEYLPQLFLSAQRYQEHLLGKSMLVIGQNPRAKGYTYAEVAFLSRHFMHLTGCKGIDMPSDSFFTLCLGKRLGPEQFTTVPETQMKLRVLPMLCNLAKEAKMMGDFNGIGNYLYTETIAGGIKGCMGFVREEGSQFLSPNTVLEQDLRQLVKECWQVMAIYEKQIEDTLYPTRPKYLAKALKSHANKLVWPKEIAEKIERI